MAQEKASVSENLNNPNVSKTSARDFLKPPGATLEFVMLAAKSRHSERSSK